MTALSRPFANGARHQRIQCAIDSYKPSANLAIPRDSPLCSGLRVSCRCRPQQLRPMHTVIVHNFVQFHTHQPSQLHRQLQSFRTELTRNGGVVKMCIIYGQKPRSGHSPPPAYTFLTDHQQMYKTGRQTTTGELSIAHWRMPGGRAQLATQFRLGWWSLFVFTVSQPRQSHHTHACCAPFRYSTNGMCMHAMEALCIFA